MAKGRGIATQATMAIGLLMLALLLLNVELAKSEVFTVGDDRGWTFNVEDWPNGKTFYAGYTLAFKYQQMVHNVLKVDSDGYEKCKTNNFISKYTSGEDHIVLERGTNYFICGIGSHCGAGMKIKVTAF